MIDLEKKFIGLGGEFLSPLSIIRAKFSKIKAIIFDWDGVFNNGEKDAGNSSSYAEGDAMGTNLFRFGFYLDKGVIPITSIFTGALNNLSKHLAEREHFNYLIFKCLDKGKAFEEFLTYHNLKAEEVAFCFDDVLDLPIAQKCGLRFYINGSGRPLFDDYITRNNLFDYKTGNSGGHHAVREVAELLLGLLGNYDQVVQHRLNFTDEYQNYLQLRNSAKTEIVE